MLGGKLLAGAATAAALGTNTPLQAGWRAIQLAVPSTGRTGFTPVPAASAGITFSNWVAQERHLTNQILLNGAGVTCGDVDGDGRVDVYFGCVDGPNKLYRNLGNWKFEDVTEAAGVACAGLDTSSVLLADVDGDGDLDLIVSSVGGGTHVFFNDGRGRFVELPQPAPLNPRRGATSMAMADIDGDGDLDLYIANYRTVTIRDQPNTRFSFRIVNGQPVVLSINGRPLTDPDLTNRFNFKLKLGDRGGTFIHEENGEPDVLLLNDGQGRFTPVSWTDGRFQEADGHPLAQPPLGWGLSVTFRDLNGDGAPDLYVCNDFNSPDNVWLNDGHGRFRALPQLALRQTPLSCMGLDIGDVNRDGYPDIFTLDMLSPVHERRFRQRVDLRPDIPPFGNLEYRQQVSRNMLQLNRGDTTFAEIAQMAGVEAADWAWTPMLWDVDLDGWEDLVVASGFERDGMNMDALRQIEMLKKEKPLAPIEQLRLRRLMPRLPTGPLAFRNLGQLRFQEVTDAWGLRSATVSQGMALADLDGDGDLDLVINNLNGPPSLFRNETSAARVAVRLKGRPPNTRGVGALVKLHGGPVFQSREVIAGGRYLSSDDPMLVFAPGPGPMQIEVRWRSGAVSVVSNVQPNHLYEIVEPPGHNAPGSAPQAQPSSAPAAVLFQDVSDRLNHRHTEEPFDDFARQPLLSRTLSQLGPGVAWCDLDGDGPDDLVVASGKGGQLAAWRNDGKGQFSPLAQPPFTAPVTRDQTTVVGYPKSSGHRLLVGSANYEDGLSLGACVRQYDPAVNQPADLVAALQASIGPLALADVDGDGWLDLFVGSRVVPGRYPEPASSLLLRGDGKGNFTRDESNCSVLANIGLVNAAVFTDLDNDADPDLVLACDWGPLKIFRNDRGKLTPWDPAVVLAAEARIALAHTQSNTAPTRLSHLTGWWNGVSAGDFDGDGRLDLVAANWGRNTKYERFRTEPLHLFYGDLDNNGTLDLIEAYYDPVRRVLLPLQMPHFVWAALPLVMERVSTWTAYGQATLEQIHGPALQQAHHLQVNWLESTLLLNRGDYFEVHLLPLEAQMSPAFAVCVADADGDGHEDLFLSQNFFGVPPETSRYDAGRGLWLRGNGQGGFTPLPGQQSGVMAYGEQRGAAVADFDQDGRVDLVLSQNAGPTKLYRNVGARPGLRVRLVGPPGNPTGVGAVMQLVFGTRRGPAREIHAGSGYWSQDSPVQVLGTPQPPTELVVRWPGGKTAQVPVPTGASELTVKY
jgi:hypothetical protein